MKKIYIITGFLFFCLIGNSIAQKGGKPKSWGLGLRLGDPTGITAKKYFGGNKALEFSVGRTNTWGRDYYYDDWYSEWYYEKYPNWRNWKGWRGWDGWRDGFVSSSSVAFQGHYLVHKDIPSLSGLRWYVGGGIQARFLTIKYRYYDDFFRETRDTHTFINLGLDGVGGLEYTFSDVPISVFLDINIYLEMVNRPFLLLGQGGIGGRYNF
jgi:hypothetical protein